MLSGVIDLHISLMLSQEAFVFLLHIIDASISTLLVVIAFLLIIVLLVYISVGIPLPHFTIRRY